MPGIYTNFINYKVPDPFELQAALGGSLVTFDANVLLDLYRGSDAYTSNMMVAMKWLDDRLFVTHQAVREFWRNRTSVLEDRTKARVELERSIQQSRSSLEQAFKNWAGRTQASESETNALQEHIDSFMSSLDDVIQSSHIDDTDNYPAPADDPILRELELLLDGRVCDQVPDELWQDRVAEALRRHENQIPPGYKEKAADKEHLPEKVAGDYLVWAQACDVAREKSTSLIIVTRDQKEDWWWRVKGAFLGPNRDLVEEFDALTHKQVYLLTPQTFLKMFADIKGTVLPEDAFESGVAKIELVESEAGEGVEAEDMAVKAKDLPKWNAKAYSAVMKRLVNESPNQAAVISGAIERGGSIDRATIYELCQFEPTRMLRGFTKPVARHTRAVVRSGLLPSDAPELLRPSYDTGPQADRWIVPQEVVAIARQR